jgi:hypothetical protein
MSLKSCAASLVAVALLFAALVGTFWLGMNRASHGIQVRCLCSQRPGEPSNSCLVIPRYLCLDYSLISIVSTL